MLWVGKWRMNRGRWLGWVYLNNALTTAFVTRVAVDRDKAMENQSQGSMPPPASILPRFCWHEATKKPWGCLVLVPVKALY